MTDRATLAQAFLATTGWIDAQRNVIAGDASNRRYDRLTRPDGSTVILMDAPPEKGEDVRPFVRIAEYLVAIGLSAPRIFEMDVENGFLLIEDLADALFARLMAQASDQQMPLYCAATDALVHLHRADPIALPACDATWLTEMSGIVFDWYAPSPEAAKQFGEVFAPLAAEVAAASAVPILRDFHAENLLWLPQRHGVAQVGLLDFQDALLGHPAYDLVSILQDARRDVPADIQTAVVSYYLAQSGADPAAFTRAYAILGAQRNLRILGIFARLGIRDGKPHYIDMIPRVWGYVLQNLNHPDLGGLAAFIHTHLPPPTPEHLEHLRRQCITTPAP